MSGVFAKKFGRKNSRQLERVSCVEVLDQLPAFVFFQVKYV